MPFKVIFAFKKPTGSVDAAVARRTREATVTSALPKWTLRMSVCTLCLSLEGSAVLR